ncbi:hypothetical protein EYZ11_012642 [Aspergillus tanneri]|uniref:Killer toxin Kp4 domain-containing protein n=1 Tax=Aspergillus tanneri TaxID=1220188 RepID=A0A4S3IZP8_9EURO|nr:hypothetical protein EYZ11_012642 [Aspergillus tanneri]
MGTALAVVARTTVVLAVIAMVAAVGEAQAGASVLYVFPGVVWALIAPALTSTVDKNGLIEGTISLIDYEVDDDPSFTSSLFDQMSSFYSSAFDPTTTSTTTTKASTSTTKTTSTVPTATETGYNCKGSIRCGTFKNLHKFCDMAKSFLKDDIVYGTTDKDKNSGTCYTDGKNAGFGCGVFVEGDNCQIKGMQMAAAYDHIFQKAGGNCGICGHAFLSDGCKLTVNYVSGCQTTNGILEAFIGSGSDFTTASSVDVALSSALVTL